MDAVATEAMMKTKKIPVPENWKDLKPHPLAALVPYGQGIDTVKLAEHMRENGYDNNEPIVIFDGKILDGRHRHVAAQEAEVVPSFVELVDGELIAYVSKKLHRQHFNESQRALHMAAFLKARQEFDASKPQKKQGETHQPATLPVSQTDAAKLAKVSERTMRDASKVEAQASEEVKQEIAKGEATVSQAAKAVGTVFCRNCRIHGPKKNCKDCVEKRKSAGVSVLKQQNPVKKPKVGAEKFNWREFDSHFGHVARGPDKIAAAYDGEKKSEEYHECDQHLRAFRKVWEKWQKRLAKIKEVA